MSLYVLKHTLASPSIPESSAVPTRMKPQSTVEKKVVRIKKRVSSPLEEAVEKSGKDGDWESGERGGSEEGRREEDGHTNLTIEQMAKGEDGPVNDVMGKPLVPVGKRRKLSRTPLSVVQTTPSTNSLVTLTATAVEPKVTTESHTLPKQAKHDHIEAVTIPQTSSPAPPPSSVTTQLNEEGCDNEREHLDPSSAAEEPSSIERTQEGVALGGAERKMSVSEMKAQM